MHCYRLWRRPFTTENNHSVCNRFSYGCTPHGVTGHAHSQRTPNLRESRNAGEPSARGLPAIAWHEDRAREQRSSRFAIASPTECSRSSSGGGEAYRKDLNHIDRFAVNVIQFSRTYSFIRNPDETWSVLHHFAPGPSNLSQQLIRLS